MIHNPDAGNGNRVSEAKLIKWIRAAGHKVEYQSSKEKKWHRILKDSADVVAVAGGDGMVGKVARRLVSNPIPMAILPMGTANNVATTLGIAATPVKDLIRGWSTARCIHFDAATARGPWGTRHFIEGFGVGLFADTMFCLKSTKDKDLAHARNPEEEIDAVVKILTSRLRKIKANRLTARLDGEDLSGDYVLLEALNIGLIGPNLNLAPEANTHDGLLDIVTVHHGHEAELRRYLTAKLRGTESEIELPKHRGRHLQIESEIFPLHIDDMGWPDNQQKLRMPSHAISIRTDPGALIFLVPEAAKQRPRRQRSK